MQISIKINWVTELSRNLRVTATKIQDFTPFIKDSLDIMKDRTDEIFKNQWNNVEKAPVWKALKSSTVMARNWRHWYYKQTPNNPWILRWTWNLQDNVTKEVWKNKWTLSYNAPYANFHQDWWGKLPKRAIIDLSNKTNELIIKAMQKLINSITKIFWRQL